VFKNIKFSFIIKDKDGKLYAKKTKDYNQIHSNETIGYNSIFNQKICHGNFIIEKIFKKINFNKLPFQDCNINFHSAFYYNEKISCIGNFYKKNNIFIIKIFQKGYLKSTLQFEKQINSFDNFKKYKERFKLRGDKYNIYSLLGSISHYVGMVYPGEKSLILNIKISKNFDVSKKLQNNKFFSYKPKKLFPIINNVLFAKDYLFYFQTAERPDINLKNCTINPIHLKYINTIKNNCFVIGGSQGLGKEYTEILKKNKKIKIYSTFSKNKYQSKKNVTYLKLDINNIEEINNIKKILSNNLANKFDFYYFASCKIKFENNLSKEDEDLQKYFFLDYPSYLIKNLKNFNLNFFYPSTTNIIQNSNSKYSKIKIIAEKRLKKICSKYKVNFKTFRFPKINSRQTVSLLDPNPKKLVDYINNNNIKMKQIFF